jgi:aspartate aminotransferase
MFKLSKQIQVISPSMTVEISNLAQRLKAEGKDVLSFSVGEPDFDTPQIIKDEAKKAIDDGFTKYTAVDGIIELKSAICGYMKKSFDVTYTTDEISVGAGAKHSLFNIFASLLDKGDEVIIPTPYWVSYPEQVKYFGGIAKICTTSYDNNFKITPELLKQSITDKTKAIILCSPSNPTGTIYARDELIAISEVLKGTDIAVISDEIYERLSYDNKKFTSIASISEDMLNRSIIVNGVSKSAAMTGWRLGFFASKDKALVKAIARFQSHSTTNINSITQKASIKAFDGSIDDDISAMKKVFEQRRDMSYDMFSKINGLKLHKPNGAFYLFIQISDISNDSLEFCKRLLEEKQVAVVPGIAFGQEGFFRFSFATDENTIKEGINRIADFVNNFKGK